MEYYGTLGPSCWETETLEKMIQAGMTGIRLNLSHRSLKESRQGVIHYQEASKEQGKEPCLMIDLQGPELRIGNLPAEMILEEGKEIILGDGQIQIPEIILPFLNKGQRILLDDGKIQLEVLDSIDETSVKCHVLCGGFLTSRKSIALPGCEINNPTLTKQDMDNLFDARKFGVTDVMLPFVRGKEDLINLREALKQAGCPGVRIFAKIENMQGVDHLDELIPYSDYIVIARGDLGNAMPLYKLPAIQYKIAEKCKVSGRKFMVVTQMLNSMIELPYPTRAEVNDIFQAVMQGASAVMLTGETAAGKYPAEAMSMLVNTGREAERIAKKMPHE